MKKYIERCQGLIQDRGFTGLLKFIYKRILIVSGDLVFEWQLRGTPSWANLTLEERFTTFLINADNINAPENKWLMDSVMRGENMQYKDGLAKNGCMLAIADGKRVAHFSFVLFETSYKKMLNEPENIPLIGNCWTSKDHRGLGLYPYAIERCCKEMASRGHKKILISCSPENSASIAGIKKTGFIQTREIKSILLLTKLFAQKVTTHQASTYKIGIL